MAIVTIAFKTIFDNIRLSTSQNTIWYVHIIQKNGYTNLELISAVLDPYCRLPTWLWGNSTIICLVVKMLLSIDKVISVWKSLLTDVANFDGKKRLDPLFISNHVLSRHLWTHLKLTWMETVSTSDWQRAICRWTHEATLGWMKRSLRGFNISTIGPTEFCLGDPLWHRFEWFQNLRHWRSEFLHRLLKHLKSYTQLTDRYYIFT